MKREHRRALDAVVAMSILVSWGLLNEYIHVLFNAIMNENRILLFGGDVVPFRIMFNIIVVFFTISMVIAGGYILFSSFGRWRDAND